MDDPGAVTGGRASVRVGLLLAAVFAIWFGLPRPEARVAPGAQRSRDVDALPVRAEPKAALGHPARKPRAAPVYAGPGPDDHAGPSRLPHPITAEHLRLYRDADLLNGASQALATRSVAGARALLAQHEREYGATGATEREGLTVLADCIAEPSAATRQRARSFYATHRASTARRQIRRECLETPANP